jgi:hypothetical protein
VSRRGAVGDPATRCRDRGALPSPLSSSLCRVAQ